MTELQELLAEREKLNVKIKAEAKEEFGAVIAGLFEKYPELENFGWLQYSHEYDDGEYVWDLYTNIKIEDRYVDFYANVERKGYNYKTPHRTEVIKAWETFPHWLLLELFGEDQYVIVYPDRVETLEYYGN